MNGLPFVEQIGRVNFASVGFLKKFFDIRKQWLE